jgi:hypothetical protein
MKQQIIQMSLQVAIMVDQEGFKLPKPACYFNAKGKHGH